jgi:choline-sulfatase
VRARPPNVLLLITDQQRYPRHWPDDPGWLRDLTPNDHRLEATGLRFRSAFCNTSMCSPSRATLLTGLYPARHGVTLTHTQADLRPDPRNLPAVTATLLQLLRGPGAPRRRALRGFGRGLLQLGPRSGNEPELRPETPNLARILREAGYEVAYKGKWHLTHPAGDGAMLGGWAASDADRLRRDYGFADWEPPDTGENAKAEHFGGGRTSVRWALAGTRSTSARSSAGLRDLSCRSRSAWSFRSSTRTTCSATPPSTSGAAMSRTSSAISESSCRRQSRKTCGTSRPCTS